MRTFGEANYDGVALLGAKSGQIEVVMAATAQIHISNMSTVSQLNWTGRRWKQQQKVTLGSTLRIGYHHWGFGIKCTSFKSETVIFSKFKL